MKNQLAKKLGFVREPAGDVSDAAGAGLTTEAIPQPMGGRLDAFWGAWTEAEVRDFDTSVEEAFGDAGD